MPGTVSRPLFAGIAAPAALVLVGAMLAACSAGGPPTAAPGDGGVPDASALDSLLGAILGGAESTNQPSGAKVQVFNAYAPKTGAPPAVDVYVDAVVTSSSKPIATVPYGTMSSLFDPGEADSSGNTTLTFMPAGVTDQSKRLMVQPLTVASGAVYTVFLTTAAPMGDGSYGGQTSIYSNSPSFDSVDATPPPGKGVLIVLSSGLDQTLASPDASSWYVSFGHGCDPGLGNDPGSMSTVDPGTTGTAFAMDPGSVTVTIHTTSPSAQADCSGTPIASASVTAKAGVTDVLLLYGKDGDIRAEMVPLE